jgi:hypothetical protein
MLHRTLIANGTKRHFAAAQQTVAFRMQSGHRKMPSAGPARMLALRFQLLPIVIKFGGVNRPT